MEAGTHSAQRQVDLRGEDEHDQAGEQVEAALDQAQPDGHGDQRDREGGQQLQDERGEERDAQRLHGRSPVLRGQRAQARRLVRCPAERDQHVEACDEVEEVVAEHGQGPPLPPRGALGVQPDEDHEDRDERHRQADDHPGQQVGEQDPTRDDGGHHRGDEQGGQVAAEVPLQPVQAAGGQRGELPGRGEAAVPWAQPQGVGDQLRPQLADHVGGRAVGGHLARATRAPRGRRRRRAAPPAPGPARPASSPPRKARVTPLASSWACTSTRPAVSTAVAAARITNRRAAEACRSNRGSSGFIVRALRRRWRSPPRTPWRGPSLRRATRSEPGCRSG